MSPPISYENVYLDAGGRQRAPRPTRPSARHGPADIAGGQVELNQEARQSRRAQAVPMGQHVELDREARQPRDTAHHQPGITLDCRAGRDRARPAGLLPYSQAVSSIMDLTSLVK